MTFPLLGERQTHEAKLTKSSRYDLLTKGNKKGFKLMIKKAIFVSLFPLLTTVKAEDSSQNWVDLALRKSGVFPPHPALVALVIVVIAAIYFMNR